MHGFHPEHEDSNASFLTNDVNADPQSITDLYKLMTAGLPAQKTVAA